jgi:ABC-type lipoprotein release transport system permease subunit
MLGIAASPLLRSVFLFAIANLNPALLAAVSLSLLAIALLAAYAPARRASRIDPTRVLRKE